MNVRSNKPPAHQRGRPTPALIAGVLIALAAPFLAALLLIVMTLTRMANQNAVQNAVVAEVPPQLTLASPATAPTESASPAWTPSSAPTETLAADPANPTAAATPSLGAEAQSAPTATWTALAVLPSETRAAPSAGNATATPTFAATATTVTGQTPEATATAAASPTAETPTATVTATAGITPTPTATATVAPAVSFAGVRGYFDQTEASFRVVGEVVNNSPQEQQIIAVLGRFYDDQNQLIADESAGLDFLPQIFVPAGKRVPFEILVDGLQSAARWDLRVEAMESLKPIREFAVEEVADRIDSGRYCVKGLVRNPGDRLQENLIVVAVLYDAGGNVINYGEASPTSAFSIFGNRVFNFDICVSPPNDGVVRYEARALGR